MYFVYILKSLKDNRFYIGQTSNFDLRLEQHNKGRVGSTKRKMPLILVKKEEFSSRGDARKRENYLKS